MIRQGLLQAKFEVGHRVWDSRVWYTKLPNSKKMDLIKINKKKQKRRQETKQSKFTFRKGKINSSRTLLSRQHVKHEIGFALFKVNHNGS